MKTNSDDNFLAKSSRLPSIHSFYVNEIAVIIVGSLVGAAALLCSIVFCYKLLYKRKRFNQSQPALNLRNQFHRSPSSISTARSSRFIEQPPPPYDALNLTRETSDQL